MLVAERRLPSGIYCMLELNHMLGAHTEFYTLWANVLYSTGSGDNISYGLGIQYAHPPHHYLQFIKQLELEGTAAGPSIVPD